MVRDARAEALLELALGVVGTLLLMLSPVGPVGPLPIFLRVDCCSLAPMEAPRMLASIFAQCRGVRLGKRTRPTLLLTRVRTRSPPSRWTWTPPLIRSRGTT
jgi:hypothetical protein